MKPTLSLVPPPAPKMETKQAPTSGIRSVTKAYEPTAHDIKEHMHLVFKVVAQMQRRLPRSVQREELVQTGTIGLLDALRKNGGELGTPSFECYARIRIKGAILDELRLHDWSPRRTKANAAARAASPDEPVTNVPVRVIGFEDLGVAEEPESETRDPAQLTERLELRRAIDHALGQLPERDRRVFELRYLQDVPAKDIAAMLGVSEARVSQIHARAGATLRTLLVDFEGTPRKAA